MTKGEWLASDTPIPMLQWLTPRYRTKNRYRYRTALFFGIACFDRVVDHRENTANWIFTRAEELAEGIPDEEPHITQAHVISARRIPTLQPLLLLLEPAAQFAPCAIVNETARIVAYRHSSRESDRVEFLIRAEQVAQANILREIIGNPFHRITFNPAWRTSDVMLLAQGIYADRVFDRMPILADALQDAGCDNDDISSHCRDVNATHVRGCWVLDLVLGKS